MRAAGYTGEDFGSESPVLGIRLDLAQRYDIRLRFQGTDDITVALVHLYARGYALQAA